MEHKAHQESCNKCQTRRDEKDSEILRNTSRQKRCSVFCQKKRDKKLEIIPTTIYERAYSKAIYEGNNHQICNISRDEIIENIEFWKCFFLVEIEHEKNGHQNQEKLLKITHPRDTELASEKYRCENAPRKKCQKNAKNAIKHEMGFNE